VVDTNEQRLQAAAQRTHNLDLQGAARKVTGLRRDLNGICKTLWGQEAGESHDDLAMLVGNHTFRALLGGSLTTPDHADFAVTDLDIRWLGSMNWGTAVSHQMTGQWPAAPQQSWLASIHTNNNGRLAVSTTGSNIVNTEHTDAAYPFRGGKAYWVRQTFDNRTTDRICNYYWHPAQDAMPTNWIELGDGTVDSGTATPFASTGVVGAFWGGFGSDPKSRFYAAEVRSSIGGTVICNPDVRNLAAGTTSFQDGTGKTWTVGGFGSII
jgi:hypothetical protein